MARTRPLTRRHFLRGTAGATIALPFLASLPPTRRVGAQPAATPKRFIAYCQPLGTFGEMFWPVASTETPYTFPTGYPLGDCEPTRNGGPKCRAKVYRTGDDPLDRPLSSARASRIIEPLWDHRDDLLFIENVDNAQGNHAGYAAMLTGWSPVTEPRKYARGISVDQAAARFLGSDTRFASLQLGVQSADHTIGTLHTVSWYGEDAGAPPSSSPHAVFERVFGDVETTPGAMSAVRAQRRSILDAATGQAHDLMARLGRADRERLDQYLTSLRDVERRLETTPVACTRPEPPPELDEEELENIPAITRLQLDLLVMAMLCDLTRVATFQMAFEATNLTHPWLGVTGRWHDLSHNGADSDAWWEDMEQYVRVSEWNAAQIAYLIDRLKETGLFDDTTILWINPMHNGQVHNSKSIPLMLAGSAGGAIRTGRHLRLAADSGRTVNDLHVAILQALGGDATTFGDPELSQGALTEVLR